MVLPYDTRQFLIFVDKGESKRDAVTAMGFGDSRQTLD
jgi:hypothetical protein